MIARLARTVRSLGPSALQPVLPEVAPPAPIDRADQQPRDDPLKELELEELFGVLGEEFRLQWPQRSETLDHSHATDWQLQGLLE